MSLSLTSSLSKKTEQMIEQDISFPGGDLQREVRTTVHVPSTRTSVPNLECSNTKGDYFVST